MVKSEDEAEIERLKALVINDGAMIYAVQKVFGDEVRAKSKEAYGRLLEAHLLIAGVFGAMIGRTHDEKSPFDPKFTFRDGLIATFVLGLPICEAAIEEGRYLQAHALIRQEVELLAQLKAIEGDRVVPGKTPQVAPLEEELRKLYGSLSNSAHLSHPHIVRQATDYSRAGEFAPDTACTRFFPEFDHEAARRSFTLHLMIMLRIVEHLNEHPGTADLHVLKDDEVRALNHAVQLMEHEGMVSAIETEAV